GDLAALVKRYGASHIAVEVVPDGSRYSVRMETELSNGRELYCLPPGSFTDLGEAYSYVSYHADWLQATLGPTCRVIVLANGHVYQVSERLRQPA
ncbi:MAG: hypothetical protein U0514_04525, partial [Candidatus Andersenbacteria bacterium]